MTDLYDTDFVEWSDRTAQLLKERRWEEIDLENLIEEVNSLGQKRSPGDEKLFDKTSLPFTQMALPAATAIAFLD